MARHGYLFPVVLLGAANLGAAAPKFESARIFIEYNSTDNDLGFHVFADAENWSSPMSMTHDPLPICMPAKVAT